MPDNPSPDDLRRMERDLDCVEAELDSIEELTMEDSPAPSPEELHQRQAEFPAKLYELIERKEETLDKLEHLLATSFGDSALGAAQRRFDKAQRAHIKLLKAHLAAGLPGLPESEAMTAAEQEISASLAASAEASRALLSPEQLKALESKKHKGDL